MKQNKNNKIKLSREIIIIIFLIYRPEEKIKRTEQKITGLVEESCIANSRGDMRTALDRAKEASTKERSLIRIQEQAGLSDLHNLELTYSVRYFKNTHRLRLPVIHAEQNASLTGCLKYPTRYDPCMQRSKWEHFFSELLTATTQPLA